ncbi:hypothetical protein CVT25_000862 [Psilocybe cyanescens]|uniref:Uncharacterized protein n=1 Tax=Psilocybe cyanescens TaxID=93625 RepID=A0A409VTE0_PSICY|nr:hypothetical protein CVT25_000862 [Psilocybe cyanescens]
MREQSGELDLYRLAFTKDPFYCKALVYGIFILETAQTILGTRSLFQSLVYEYTDALSAEQVRDLWFSFPVLGGIVTAIVQLFYARRIIILGSDGYGKIGGIVIISFIAGVLLGAKVHQVGSFLRSWHIMERLLFQLTRSSAGMERTRKFIRNIPWFPFSTLCLVASRNEDTPTIRFQTP